MREFHVYGIGNALVDIDFEISAATLTRLKIDKGVMTLIDEETHHYLLEELDGIKHLKACGGSAANSVFTMQQMGAKTFYSCKLGADEAGDFFYQSLLDQGVQTNLNACAREGVTGKCIVLVTPDADRTMNTFLGATARLSKAQVSEEAIKNSQYIYIEGYLVATESGREAAIYARELAEKHAVKTTLCLSDPNMIIHFHAQLLEIMGRKVDILFCNESEALLFTRTNHLNLAKEALKQYARTFVITQGGNGAWVYDGEDFLHIPAYPAKVVDTVGAGDVYAGSFLYGITHGYDYFAAGDFANYAASKVVQKFGPRLNREEILDVCKRLQPAIAL